MTARRLAVPLLTVLVAALLAPGLASASPRPVAAQAAYAVTASAAVAATTPVYGDAAGVSVIKVKDGTWRSFAIASNGQIYQQIKRASWSGPESLGGSFKGAPAVIYRASDHRFDVLAVSKSGTVMLRSFVGGKWRGWTSTGVRGFTGALSAIRDRNGALHLFGAGSGGAVLHAKHPLGGSWSTVGMGTGIRGNVSLVYQPAAHRFDLFAVRTDRKIEQRTFSGGAWAGWHVIGQGSFAGGITAVRLDSLNWRVMAVGTNRQVYRISYSHRAWSAPGRLGGSAIGTPGSFWDGSAGKVVTSGPDRRLHIQNVGSPCCTWTTATGAIYPKPSPPPPPAPTRVTLAKTLLARWGGRLTGLSGAKSDLQVTAAGRAVTSCGGSVYLDPKMLTSIVKATDKYQVFINNMVSGHSCDSGYHPKGKAVDFNTVVDPATGRHTNWHSYESGDNRALDAEFLSYVASAITSGGGAGQVNCPGSAHAPVPAGMLRFSDYCNHQHLDSR